MLIGAMNHPAENVLSEIKWMADMKLDFIDLTIEPPAAAWNRVKPAEIARMLADRNMKVVGHTAFYLPIASPFEAVRRAAVAELERCLDIFAEVGAEWMNLHPDSQTPMHTRSYCVSRNVLSITELAPKARDRGIGLMIENLPGGFNTPDQIGEILDPLPDLGLHLDIGHANLLVVDNVTEPLLKAFGSRLRHVHLHDNKGGSADLHLPLGSGTLDLNRAVRALKKDRYDGTITLEVFAHDREYLRYSRDLLRRAWNDALS